MDFSNARIEYLIIHEVGNKLRDEKNFLSSLIQNIDEDLEKVLLNYFLKPFLREKEFYEFQHSSNINLNEVYTYCKEIFKDKSEETFINISKNIANHLYDNSLHPKITKGELLIVKFSNILYNNEEINLVGIFKSENKDTFLKILKEEDSIKLKDDDGININKIEKGCIVLNYRESTGFSILNIDNNKATEYWQNKFLNIKYISNNQHKTKEIISICKNFSNEILSKKFDTEIEFTFNNDYINYFEDNDFFNKKDLADSIFKIDDIKEDFFKYYENNKQLYDFDFNDTFELSKNDVKKEKKKIRNIIKLDTKLELNVLLDKENGTKNIEKGYDQEKEMYYYKIYFNEEIN